MIKKTGDFNEGGAVTWKETPVECLKSFQNIALFQNCNLQYAAGDSSGDKVLTKFDVSQGFYTLEWLARYPIKGGGNARLFDKIVKYQEGYFSEIGCLK